MDVGGNVVEPNVSVRREAARDDDVGRVSCEVVVLVDCWNGLKNDPGLALTLGGPTLLLKLVNDLMWEIVGAVDAALGSSPVCDTGSPTVTSVPLHVVVGFQGTSTA